ncbi:hypothetical protein GOZ78_22520 [Agrobacterium vitis]|uniref:Phage holin family protein n=1 Tax=Agrobacterium vitis TaxID=373 RepID=A0ABD6GJT4_AGRVI|nr:hypothetical protein [Agrobacterium vitis]MUO81695.1 hypothetical protein [Agrobacterium vitis]MUO96752.1 hypothetical protein [Agrobacterium vitis]MUP07441.1 hypothetical protein [Agrobacterium vitis]MUZ85173.1 hypothetical protein [Agrobacterium vitis]MVA12779.1 hypothetical protein [Agrobacterium vitis]
MFGLLTRLTLVAAEGVKPRIDKARRNAIAGVIAGFCFLIAIVAAIVSGWIFLAAEIGAGPAGLVIAGVAVLIGLITLAIVSIINRREARRRAFLQTATLAATDPLTMGLMGRLPGMLKVNPIVGVAAVGMLAYLFARSQGIGRK